MTLIWQVTAHLRDALPVPASMTPLGSFNESMHQCCTLDSARIITTLLCRAGNPQLSRNKLIADNNHTSHTSPGRWKDTTEGRATANIQHPGQRTRLDGREGSIHGWQCSMAHEEVAILPEKQTRDSDIAEEIEGEPPVSPQTPLIQRSSVGGASALPFPLSLRFGDSVNVWSPVR